MPRLLSGLRVAKVMRQSVQNVEENTSLDFSFAVEEGARIFQVRFDVSELVSVPGGADVSESAFLALHVEEGNLEDSLSVAADRLRLNSEIMAENAILVLSSNVAAEGPPTVTWMGSPVHNFPDGFDVALNPQFSVVTSAATLTMNGAQVTILYKYIQFTQAELAAQFLLRR